MNVFDFDNTLYHGESVVDFALFMLRHNKQIYTWLPTIFWYLMMYKLCLVTKEQMERKLNEFLKVLISDDYDLHTMVKAFWKENAHKLDPAMLRRIRPEDVILTASPDFMMNVIGKRLGTTHILCSVVDIPTKTILYLNFGTNKVKRFRKLYRNTQVRRFYTDSYNDQAMIDLAQTAYLVENGKVKRIK
ncbi:MAG: haloacid dehalogenase-like hydrolase [Oscillospiraceae bacterium]|nr:haloacid dehalogenase-like hydrolase [Oscillospiraceae bacterium]